MLSRFYLHEEVNLARWVGVAIITFGVAVAAYEQWLQDDDSNLSELLDTAMRDLAAAFGDGLPLLAGPAG